MSSQSRRLAERKEFLVARSTMLRLRVASDVLALREGLRFGNVRRAIAEQPAGRKALFALLLLAAGSRQLARMVRVAAAALAVAKAVTTVAQLVHRPTSAASSQSSEASS